MSSASPIRIQWLHKKIAAQLYPNVKSLSDRYHISLRQAQRDISYLKDELNAPVRYEPSKKGYVYTQPYTLPSFITNENDEAFMDIDSDELSITDTASLSELSGFQMQLPSFCTVAIKDKLAVMELNKYISATKAPGVYECTYRNVDHFLGVLMSLPAHFRIIEPEWLREKMIKNAKRILENNEDAN
jgi:predicted DNA-binding transcriptional regulator YafY